MHTPKPISSKQNKVLLVFNCILVPTALVLGVVSLYYEQWISGIAMFLVLLSSIFNVYACWKRLKGK